MSPSLTWLFGGIGTGPHTPAPPSFTFLASLAGALASPLYLAATSRNAGPTIFFSTAWHAVQPDFCDSASLASAHAGPLDVSAVSATVSAATAMLCMNPPME